MKFYCLYQEGKGGDRRTDDQYHFGSIIIKSLRTKKIFVSVRQLNGMDASLNLCNCFEVIGLYLPLDDSEKLSTLNICLIEGPIGVHSTLFSRGVLGIRSG